MPHFSNRSMDRLQTCDTRIVRICLTAIEHYDFTVICGHRGEKEQNEMVTLNRSKLNYPHSKHNEFPSHAVDLAPYSKRPPHIMWQDRESFFYLAGLIMAISIELFGVKIRWGGDFGQDYNFKNDRFIDLPHFEIDD